VTFSGKKYESPKQLVDEFFEVMDLNHDGKISLEEYKEGALKNPDIIRMYLHHYHNSPLFIEGLKLFT
jgi:hypothetical protein